MVVNGWNNTLDNNNSKTFGAAVSYASGALVGVCRLHRWARGRRLDQVPPSGGRHRHLQVGQGGRSTSTRDFGIDTNKDANGDSPKWYGVAVAGRYQATGTGAVALRGELFKDANGFSTGVKQTLIEGTLTGEYKPADGLVLRAEAPRRPLE